MFGADYEIENCPCCKGEGVITCRRCDGEGVVTVRQGTNWKPPWLPCVLVAVLGLGLWTLNAAAAPARPAAGAAVAARYTLIVELELLQDGTSRAVSSQVITGSAQVVELAKVWVAREAGATAPGAPTPSPAAAGKPSFAGQCAAQAASSGKQCRKRAITGSPYCDVHQGRAE